MIVMLHTIAFDIFQTVFFIIIIVITFHMMLGYIEFCFTNGADIALTVTVVDRGGFRD